MAIGSEVGVEMATIVVDLASQVIKDLFEAVVYSDTDQVPTDELFHRSP